jgi:hypothetical protein
MSLALVQKLCQTALPAHFKNHGNASFLRIRWEKSCSAQEVDDVRMPQFVNDAQLEKDFSHNLLPGLSVRTLAHSLDSYRLGMYQIPLEKNQLAWDGEKRDKPVTLLAFMQRYLQCHDSSIDRWLQRHPCQGKKVLQVLCDLCTVSL